MCTYLVGLKGRPLTLVAVGDAASLKTELLMKYTYHPNFYLKYMPTYFTSNVQDIIVDGRPYDVLFLDAETDDDFLLQRIECFEKADCIIVCYAISDRASFENVKRKWCMEIRKSAPYRPILLVATDTESRTMVDSHDFVTFEEGQRLKYVIGAAAFVECSVRKCVGIDDVFIEAVRSTYYY